MSQRTEGGSGESARDARGRMVQDQLLARGIRDPRVLSAMEAVPREFFVPERDRDLAYHDRALPLSQGQTVSQPYMVAVMTEALRPGPADRVLEIGTGSGYQTAVLASLVGQVYSVERFGELADDARARLERLGVENVHFLVGDGTLGWPEHAPFDAILVTAGAPSVPPALRTQLSVDGGRLVIPVGDHDIQDLVRLERHGTEWRRETLLGCRFVPLVGEGGWEG